MRSFVGPVVGKGALIQVKFVSPVQSTGDGRSNGPSVDAVALIDTGASTTTIPYGTAARLGLAPVGKLSIVSHSNPIPQQRPTYRVRLLFPHAEGEVVASEHLYGLPALPYSCLIGRDVLKYALLFYDGTNDMFSLIFKEK